MSQLELRVIHDIAEIGESDWNRLLRSDDNPFVSWRFLEALESTGCASADRGWLPCHLTVWQEGVLLAACPAYAKADSAGDFSRDWGFADAALRNGIDYYPKLVIGVPFSPVTGRRILVGEGQTAEGLFPYLAHLALELARQMKLSSIHALYHLAEEAPILAAAGFAGRLMIQYHWLNRDFANDDEWLASLSSKRRTQIRRERSEPQRQGISIRTIRGPEIEGDPERWASEAWGLYERNSRKHYWGGAYLNQDFFNRLLLRNASDVELVVAERDGRVIAGATNIATPTHLFGRYWGCHEEHRFLHFNVCLYHSIAQSIERCVRVFEGGAGGEHKRSRGFDPALVFTSHRFLHQGFHDAVSRHLVEESAAVRRSIAAPAGPSD